MLPRGRRAVQGVVRAAHWPFGRRNVTVARCVTDRAHRLALLSLRSNLQQRQPAEEVRQVL
jgi:hypothetical protein